MDEIDRLRTSLADRYAIERALGAGGMATVYLAEDLKHRRKVALKVFRPELTSALGPDRFLREIEIAARLNHPHIVALYDSGNADGALFYVMPYIRGESLREKLEREGQLPLEEALTIARQVASALDHAHAQGLVHRDVKPANVLLYEGEAMIADFGIAVALSSAASERLTQSGIVVGTPQYMSPEQAMHEGPLDARSDIYGLGCILYEMLAGEPPFGGRTAMAVIAKRLVDPAPSVRRLRGTVPPEVDRAIMKALARLPADRFASARDFSEALSRSDGGSSRQRSVGVLPFLNLSGDPDNEYFADGVTEDVIAHLSKVRTLKVISRTSMMPFKNRELGLKEIASQLDVATLLEGSVRRAGDRVRIVAQLIDAESDRHLWAETYDRQLTDIFAIQTDVALHIAAALKAELSPDERTRIEKEPTGDLEAYQLYLQGRSFAVRYTTEWTLRGIEYFERAAERDPRYALPHVGMAIAHIEMAEGGTMPPQVAYARAKEATARALELDPGLGQAHAAAGYLKTTLDFDWTGAEKEFKRALELGPNDADTHDLYGRLCNSLGRHEEAIALTRRAQQLDPLAHRSDLATALLRAGRYDEALAAAKHAIEFDDLYDRAHAGLGWAYLKKGMAAEGVAELERAVALSPRSTLWQAQLGQALAMLGEFEKARGILRGIEARARDEYVSPYHLAYVYTGLGEHDHAMDLLERAFEKREGAVYGIGGSFLFTDLHSHPRFIALLRKMNLAPPDAAS
jgi:serine/threonine protein kinase/tetratricopeptide (TPR) repeat protein